MLLELDAEVFAGHEDPNPRLIFTLIGFMVDGRHRWFPRPEVAKIAEVYLEKHFPTMTIWHEYLRNASTASAWQTPSSRPVVQVTAGTLEPVTKDLGRPAIVLVENGRNDGSFLKAVFAAYDPSLAEAERLEWLHIDHSGGTGDQRYLADEHARRFTEICRVIVVKDNDEGVTGSAFEDESTEWPPRKPRVHVWHRLEVENYLPDKVLMESPHPDAQAMISHLRRMNSEQQRLMDMKGGLNKATKAAQKEAFKSLSPDLRQAWRTGFAKQFPSPLVPETITLTVDDFARLGPDVHYELTELLARIRNLT
ncbi:MAG: hypothetical protein HOQ31_16350 [Gemmatimonadaceae bacterium]|nr:hypothetical protein [Gemmatimonadaceae bacterium]NUT05974.1 hypothetical protein [Hamadaea sp.]